MRNNWRAACGRVIKAVLPARHWCHFQAVRARNHQFRWLRDQGLLHLAEVFLASNGSTVLHGPFAGMRFPVESMLCHHSIPMILGSYESELHSIVDAAVRKDYDIVVDVGSAEGYYAVGFAMKGRSPVTAFDADPRELKRCAAMARLNSVEERVTLRGWCSSELLRALTAGRRSFVLSDCEGYETELFDGASVMALERSDALIELHGDAYEPLLERFARTHAVRTIEALPRLADDYPALASMGADAERAVSEYRLPRQRWLYASALQA